MQPVKTLLLRCFFCALFLAGSTCIVFAQKTPLYKQASAPVEKRVKDLLSRMTLDEKIAQLSHLHGHQLYTGQLVDEKKLAAAAGDKGYGCVEAFTLTGENTRRAMLVIQKYMVEKTRLGIPALPVTESLHGSVQDGSTIFPQSVALGSTFNTGLAYKMTAAISQELTAQGMWQSLSPGMDVVRDLRWGRVEEAFGEDPWLVGQIGISQVKGYLDNGVLPMLKPIGAGGAPLGGLNLASVECGVRDMRDIYLKPYEMVVKATRVPAVMSSYNSWNHIPNSASRQLLTDILRTEWGFKGYVYSDWAAVSMLKDFHHTAKDDADAARQALTAGIDLEASSNCYEKLAGLVREKALDGKLIDQAVERILRVKFSAGLFDGPYRQSRIDYKKTVHAPAAVQLAREIADESIVLLKNDQNLLPLDVTKIRSVAVIGPNAAQVQFGDYTWSRDNKDGVTPLEGIKNLVGKKVTVNYAQGCDLVTAKTNGFAEAVAVAGKSDVSLVFVGSASASLARDYSAATTGEGFDLSDLNLTGVQEELIKSIYKTGKPVVVVLVTGKPFSIPWLKAHIPAIAVQWYGGERAGDAIAAMLFGQTNPSGRLPFSFPQSVGHLPVFYNYLPTDKGYYHRPGTPEKPGRDYVFSSPAPLWAFGHGLSYTDFRFDEVKLFDTVFREKDTVKIEVMLTNTGRRNGHEVVQLYVRDLVSSVATPVKQLKGFAKPLIKAGETATVQLALPVSELALYNTEMKRVVEPGDFELQIGNSSDHILIKKIIRVTDGRPDGKQKNTGKRSIGQSPEGKTENRGKLIDISGEIRDVQATPVAGITVTAKLSGKRSTSDAQGRYTIKAYENDVLQFSAPAYEAVSATVKGQTSINIRISNKQN